MKNLKIAMIFVAAVAFFCSCGNGEAPSVTMTGDVTSFDLATASSLDVNIDVNVKADKGINTLSVTRTMYNANDEILGDVTTYELEEDPAGLTEKEFSIKETLTSAEVAGAAKVVYAVAVVDKKDATGDADYTISVITPAYTEATFTWKREGTTVTPDMSEFGLVWGGTTTDLKATFKPVEGGKLYVLAAADFEQTSDANVAALLAGKTPVESYHGISAAASNNNLTDVLATVNGGKTYLFRLEKSTVVSRATHITVTGTYRLFNTVEAPAAK